MRAVESEQKRLNILSFEILILSDLYPIMQIFKSQVWNFSSDESFQRSDTSLIKNKYLYLYLLLVSVQMFKTCGWVLQGESFHPKRQFDVNTVPLGSRRQDLGRVMLTWCCRSSYDCVELEALVFLPYFKIFFSRAMG